MARKLEVEIIGDASSLERAFGKASKSGSGFGKVAKAAAIGVGAAFAGMAVVVKMGFDELAEGQKVSAQTAATLKSTGGAANVTAKQVENLASQQSALTGIDDELIQASENLLLTFKNVRNEVGANNDVFNQATKAALDLSTAGFGSVESASKMMGKALNDPIKGMTALGRAGVTFSESQKETIKGLVETGDLLGAQKIILKEVESQVGGSAKAYGQTLPGQLSKLKNAFEEAAAGLAAALLPFLTKFAAWVTQHMPQIQEAFREAGAIIASVFDALGPVVTGIVIPALKGLYDISKTLIDIYREYAAIILPAAAAFGVLAAAVVVYIGVTRAVTAVTKAWAAAQLLLNAIMALNPFVLIAVALIALGVALVVAYKKSETFRDIVQAALKVVQDVFQRTKEIAVQVFNAVAQAIDKMRPAIDKAMQVAQQFFNAVKTYIGGIVQIVKGVIDIVVGILTGDWARAWSGVKQVVQGAVQAVKGILQGLPAIVLGLAVDVGRAIINGIISGFTGLLGSLKDSLESKLKSVVTSLSPFSSVEEGGAKHIGKPLAVGAIKGWLDGSKELPAKMSETLRDAVTRAADAITAGKDAFASAFGELASAGLSAFDKITAEFETRTEKLIRKQDEAIAKQERLAARVSAQEELTQAQVAFETVDVTDPAAIQAAQDAILAASQKLAEANLAIQRAANEKKAANERAEYEASRERQRLSLEKQLARLQQNYLNQEITTKEFHQRLIGIFKAFEVPLGKAANKLGAALADGLNASFNQVENAARNLAATIVKRLSEITVKVNVELQDIKGGIGPAGKQHGGPVRGGTPYVVGEAGPELFIPRNSGKIIPNGGGGGAAVGGVVNLNFYGPTVGTSREFEDTVRRAIYNVSRRNPGSGL